MDLRRALAEVVGERHAFDDPELAAGYETDWTGRWTGRSRAVVRPADAGEVARVVRVCAEAGAAIVPQGGNTGLVGASVPRGGEVLLSLRRLERVGAFDPALGQVTVGAGATLAALQAAVSDAGLDFGARDSCTVGGLVACDAGGARALRHGTARARVAGLEAVLADGTVVARLSGLVKDNAGYDLPGLLVGSEGTLGIVTAVRWRAVPRLARRVAALVPVESPEAAAELLGVLRAHVSSLEACDFLTDDCLSLALAHQRRPAPVARRAPLYLLAECAADHDPLEELAAALGEREASVADDTASREGLWRLREGVAEAIAALGVPVKLDVGVPLAELGAFLRAVGEVCGDARPYLFGHLGDGNVHVNLLGDAPDEDGVLELVLSLGGTISAEHGVGVAKAAWLERARGAAEVAAMRAVKAALDPQGILNPGAVLPAPITAKLANGPRPA